MKTYEVNFDGIVGPTHNYSGLSHGNIASMQHGGGVSNPREAALQGLAKMKLLSDLGLKQAVLPPHDRPSLDALRALGFRGNYAQVLEAAATQSAHLLEACSSASAMWTANAATVTPSSDTADCRVHFTPANLVSKFHRSLEAAQTERTLRAIFADKQRFVVHSPVPASLGSGDEGAANHTRFAVEHGEHGLHLFVHGHCAFGEQPKRKPKKYPARQALEAFEVIARRHLLPEGAVVHARQHPAAIDAGVFHNDVISVGNESLYLCHEKAFEDTAAVIGELRRAWERTRHEPFRSVIVPSRRVSLADAVKTYLFNSQLVTIPSGEMLLIAPTDCEENPRVSDYINELLVRDDVPITGAHFIDLKQSMRNGGGPACLRLRVVLGEAEMAAVPQGVFLTDGRYEVLTDWVRRHYRDRLRFADLADPTLVDQSRRALDELTRLLGLGSIYPFQKA